MHAPAARAGGHALDLSMISARGQGRSIGERTLFAGAICLLHPGKRYRLLGANGSGRPPLWSPGGRRGAGRKFGLDSAAIPSGLELPAQVRRSPLATLSGGFRLRVLVAQVLESAPNSLLHGHTSHLDILSIRWLEMLLVGFPAPVLVIIHNHRFLDNCGHRNSGHRLRGGDRLRGQPRPLPRGQGG